MTALRQTPRRKQTRYTYTEGPMFYLGQQIVRAMQDAGFPAKIHCCYRSPADQEKMFLRGVSKAHAGQSAHQYYMAVDIIHAHDGWPPGDDPFWEVLASCVEVVAERFHVALDHGHHWSWRDSAHIELEDWRALRDLVALPPSKPQLAWLFETVLPGPWRQFQKSKASVYL